MDAIGSIQENIGTTRWLVQGTMEGVGQELANKQPGGTANSVGSLYAHLILSEDFMVNTMLQGKPPLAATIFAGKTGVSEMPPAEDSADMAAWFKRVQVDLATLRTYAQAVEANTDEYVAGLKPEDLDRKVTFFDMGEQSVNWVLGIATCLHANSHIGEISVLKGLQGLKGYPI